MFFRRKQNRNQLISQLPNDPDRMPSDVTTASPQLVYDEICRDTREETPILGINLGANYFSDVLEELEKLKNELGGSPGQLHLN